MKILAFTAIRSEYDLLSHLYKLLNNDPYIELKLIVSGAHLSNDFGYSVNDIENDDLCILAKLETLINSDSKSSRLKSASILLLNSIDIVANYNPDLILYAGDREEVLIAATIGGYLQIPTIHFFGGDHVADSHIDNPIRHAASKLSSIHMVSTDEHKKRLICMGESASRIYNIGSIALDKFQIEKILTKDQIKKIFSIKIGFSKFAVLIFHPIPYERENTSEIFNNILMSLKLKNIYTFVSFPNIDPGNKDIIKVIGNYKNDSNFIFYKTLPRQTFISIFKQSLFIIGNSSAGILESASVPVGAINVGYRQTGRKPNNNIIFVGTDISTISQGIDKCLSNSFQSIVNKTHNFYGDGKSSKRALELIKTIDFNKFIFKDEDALGVVNE